MGVPAENGVDARYPRSQLQVGIHAVVRQQYDRVGAFCANLVDCLLQPFFLDAEGPVGNQVPRIGDGCVGEGLTDDRDRCAVLLRGFELPLFQRGDDLENLPTMLGRIDLGDESDQLAVLVEKVGGPGGAEVEGAEQVADAEEDAARIAAGDDDDGRGDVGQELGDLVDEVLVPVGGLIVNFNQIFNAPPEVQATFKGGGALAVPEIGQITKTGFRLTLINPTTQTSIAGNASWAAEGY